MLQTVREFVMNLPWSITVLFCLTLGLAPFVPIPHIWEKLKMLYGGTLIRPIDWFDFLMHGAPWLLLILKIIFTFTGNKLSHDR
jgi:hypothetical protein